MIQSFEGHEPQLGQDVFVAPNATVLGRVTLGDQASVWYGAVLRGDVESIFVGARTNIQDLCVVHVTTDQFSTYLGTDVTVGHRAILHGCRVSDRVLIGMGAVLMDGVEIGDHCIVGAGALLPPGKVVPPGSVVMGSPGRVIRKIRDAERQQIEQSSPHYVDLAQRHRVLRRC